MSIPQVPANWSPLHAVTLLQIAVAAADGAIDDVEIDVMVEGVAAALDGGEAGARVIADQAYEYLQAVFREGGADAADTAIANQTAYLKEVEEPSKLQAHVHQLVRVAEASPGMHRAESAAISKVAQAWGIET